MADKLTLFLLCTGNSCRSQMAEWWDKHFATGHIEVQSAGIEAHGKNPRAIAVMAEAGQGVAGHD